MWKCIRCEKENQDFIENCMECGHGKTMNYIEYKTVSKVQDSVRSNWKQEQNTPEYFKKKGIEHLKKTVEYFRKANMDELDKNIQEMIIAELNKYISLSGNKEKPVLMACADENFVLGTNIPREEICEIEFVKINETTMSDDAWDVSAEKNKTIWAWTENTENGKILKIGSENGVYANPDCQSFFEGYSNVVKIEFHDLFDTGQVTDMTAMFYQCDNLENLNIQEFNTKRVKNMSCMFYGCEGLEMLDVRGFDTSQVTDMSNMFDDCKKLKSLDVHNFNTSCVTNMGCMFAGCEEIKQLDVSRFDTSQVTDMGCMFMGCELLSELDISGFDTRHVTSMTYMFLNCKCLEKLDVSGFDTRCAESMRGMFYKCQKVKELDVSGFDTSQVTDMMTMFAYCYKLNYLDISNFDTWKVTEFFGMFRECKEIETLDVSKFDTGRATNMRDMFSGCKKLERLDVSNFDTEQVTDMSYMFSGCENLVDLDISNFYFRKDVKFEDMFKDSAMAEVYDEKAIQELYRKDNLEKSDTKKPDPVKPVSADEKFLDELCALKDLKEVRKKQFTVYNHEQLDKRKNKRIYEENSIKEIVNKFLLYEENKVINNGKTTNKALIKALQISSDDEIYLLHDHNRYMHSIFASQKLGFALTNRGMYRIDSGRDRFFMPWELFKDSKNITINYIKEVKIDGQIVTNIIDEEIALQLEMMFIAIYKQLNAEEEVFIDW